MNGGTNTFLLETPFIIWFDTLQLDRYSYWSTRLRYCVEELQNFTTVVFLACHCRCPQENVNLVFLVYLQDLPN